MPRLKYATILRILVILGFLCLWVQILLSVSNDNLDKDGVTEKTKFSGLKLDTDLKSLVTEKTEFSDTDLKVTEKTEFSTLKLDTDLKALVTEKTEFSALKLDTDLKEELMNNNETSEQVLAQVPVELHKYLTVHPRNVSGNATDRNGSPKNISDILQLIHKHNDAQIIHNEDIFGPVQNDTLIIAIQVHTRLTYLRHLIVSLAQAKDIDSTLLVFSHDYYDEEVNALVRSIDFTKVMQIFYPFSIQTHPNEFPGVDPNDCPRDAKLDQALKLKCNNALHPDVHGHYREAKYTQTKHHWWWKANRIFNQLQCTTGHSGMVLFLEEDHYVAEDFIHMMSLLRSTADKSCPNCEILCLGTYLKTYLYHVNSDKQRKKQLSLSYIQQVRAAGEERRKKYQDAWNFQVYPHLYGTTQKVEITPWYSSMHNMGFAINRTVWNNIMELEQQFCAYDDYNWDYSLLHLSQNRPNKQKFKVMLCKGPRVFHIGECGFHHKKKNCNPSIVISKVQKLIKNAKRFLYPTRLTATITSGGAKHNKRLVKGNGGWGDNRDQQLCSNMTKVGRQSRKFDYTSEILSLNRINSVIF